MPKKGERKVAPRIMYVLEQNNGVSMRFSDIFKGLAMQGWYHHQVPISKNLDFLVEQKKIVHIGNQYALIQTRSDGSRFAIIKDSVEKIVELDK